ncbi:MAG TPA: acyltransferase [Acidobacteriaceae bacterium]|nr:acyltransferase [Acidobacteriaceae bacterium]
MGQIDGLQALRAIAVFLVAWTHCGQLFLSTGMNLPQLGIFGVDVFFVISGFILSLLVLRETRPPGVRTMWNFLRRRLVRIFPVYLVFALLPLAHHFHHGLAEGLTYVPAIFLLPGLRFPDLPTLANFSWTLIFEMFFYLLFAALLLVAVRRAAAIMGWMLVGLVCLGAVIDFRRPILAVVMNPILLEFAFGVCIAILYSRYGLKRKPRVGVVLFVLGWTLAFVAYSWKTLGMGQFQNDILAGRGVMLRALTLGVTAGLIVAGTVFWSPGMRSFAGRVMVLLGNSSYSAYLLSGYLFETVGPKISRRVMLHGYVELICAELAVAGVLMGLGVVFYLLIEKPLLRVANRLLPAANTREKRQAPALQPMGAARN